MNELIAKIKELGSDYLITLDQEYRVSGFADLRFFPNDITFCFCAFQMQFMFCSTINMYNEKQVQYRHPPQEKQGNVPRQLYLRRMECNM